MALPFVEVPAWTPRVKEKAMKGKKHVMEKTGQYKAYLEKKRVEWAERAEQQRREEAAKTAEYSRFQAEDLARRQLKNAQAREEFKNSSKNYMAWKAYIME